MKVVHVIVGLNVGGAELMLKRLIIASNSLYEIKHEVISLTDAGVVGEEISRHGIPVHELKVKGYLGFFCAFFKLYFLLRKLKPDVIHTWMYHSDFLGGLAAKMQGIKRIFWGVRNTKLSGRGVGNYAFRKLCSMLSYVVPQKIIFVSNSAMKEHLSEGYAKKKAKVIGNGFDTEVFVFDREEREKIREEWGVSDQDFLVSSIGRYAQAKDHLTFIRAMKKVIHLNPSVYAVIVGRGVPGNRALICEISGVESNFIFLESRTDVASVLSACDMFCLHSITEGFPNVLGEAMSVGLPCVTTRAGDAETILSNAALTCDPGDHLCIASKITDVLNMTHSERLSLGSSNRNRIVEKYSLKSVIDAYYSLYND